MPRNESGVYTLPAGNPVVVGTTIEATWANPTMSDLGNEITASLPRAGTAPMTGPLLLARDGVLSNEAVTVSQLQTQITGSNNYLPAGAIQAFATSSIPTGWLECDGSEISRTTYSDLFATIGTTYGVGNGTTTFNVPDLRGMFVRGLDRTRGVDAGRVLGTTQSPTNQTHNHVATVTNPAHAHGVGDPGHNHTLTDPGHAHNVPLSVVAGGAAGYIGGVARLGQITDDANTTGITLAAAATGVSVQSATQGTTVAIGAEGSESRPYNVAMIYCIKLRGSLQTSGLIESSNVIYTYDVPRTMEDKLSEWISVLDFGAVGDGVTDDYPAFLAAAAEINSIGGGTLFIPAGTYLLGTPLQMKGFIGVHLRGAGIDATTITKDGNYAAASIRFYLGEFNSISDLTLDCDGYDGRGIYLQDRYSFAERVKVVDCPDRPLSMNGGSNTVWGLDSEGRESTDPDFTSVSFYPFRCRISECVVINAGRTALSQKQMQSSLILNNYVDGCYSEGVTVDITDNAVVAYNHLVDVARTDGATAFPDKIAGAGFLSTGAGGVGGMGIDGSTNACVIGNTWNGVETNIATVNNRSKAAICFQNNVDQSVGCRIVDNTIISAKAGVYLLAGTGGNNFNHTISQNIFQSIGTGAGTGSSFFGDVIIDAACTYNTVKDNWHPGGTLLYTIDAGFNSFDYRGLISVEATAADFSVPPTADDWLYNVDGNTVSIDIPAMSGTSSTGTFTFLTTLPLMLRPTSTKFVLIRTRDNSTTYGIGVMSISPGGVLTVYPTQNVSTAWTSSNTKGVLETTITYQKDQ